MVKSHTIDLNDVRLHYAEAPGPGPALVILHGLSGSHAEFLHLVPELVKHAHVYLLDLRGHGLSGRASSGYRIPDYERDVVAFLKKVVRRPAIVVGHSLGGLVAAWLTARMPSLVEGLLLEDAAIYVVQQERFVKSMFYSYFSSLRRFLEVYHGDGCSLEDMVSYVAGRAVDENYTVLDVAGPDAVRERAIQLHQMDPAVLGPLFSNTLLNGKQPDEILARVRCPVHVLAADPLLGAAVTNEDLRRMVMQMPHASHATIEQAGHDIHLDQPQQFLMEVQQFLESVVVTQPA
jgi:pimeloyl-ACP methyl ester carboxylesterase